MKIEDKKTRTFSKLMAYSILYGLVLINYIDIVSSGGYAYHLWLVVMYFAPFVIFSVVDPKNWKLTISLGLISSLMNDIFYGLIAYLVGKSIDLFWYYKLWLIPRDELLFDLNFGVLRMPVFSWMMALSIYSRIILVYMLTKNWKMKKAHIYHEQH
jgi:hypothetical protein